MKSIKFDLNFLVFLAVLSQILAANDYAMKKFNCASLDETRLLVKCENTEKFISLRATFVRPLNQLLVRVKFNKALKLTISSCSSNSIALEKKTEH
jgi:hypothetical protein